jgi:hypothetical protein
MRRNTALQYQLRGFYHYPISLLSLIIKGKPPALPGDSQSLTFSGVLYSPSPSPAKQGRLSGTEKLNNSV